MRNAAKAAARLAPHEGHRPAHVFRKIGDESPDVEGFDLLKRAFGTVQELVAEEKIKAGHDVSGGGLVTTLLEMAFAENCGLRVDLEEPNGDEPIKC